MAATASQNKLQSIAFWGKIKEYLVVVGVVEAEAHPSKKFFFCESKNFTLGELPALSDEQKNFIGALSRELTGEPGEPVADGDDVPESCAELTETDQLSCVAPFIPPHRTRGSTTDRLLGP